MKSKIIQIVFAGMLALILSGCARPVYQNIERASSMDSISAVSSNSSLESIRTLLTDLKHSVNVRDSVVIRDSVVLVVNEVGDVVSKEAYHNTDTNHSKDETISKLEAKYDSIFKAQREQYDAVLKKFEQTMEQTPIEIEKRLSVYESIKQEIGGITIGLIAASIIIAVIWLIRKLKKQQYQ